jgi:preprotein translocase subunit YajC
VEIVLTLLIIALVIPVLVNGRKRSKETTQLLMMQENVQIGDRVITTSGLYGTVVGIEEDTVDLQIADRVVTRWMRLAIREVLRSEPIKEEEATGQ